MMLIAIVVFSSQMAEKFTIPEDAIFGSARNRLAPNPPRHLLARHYARMASFQDDTTLVQEENNDQEGIGVHEPDNKDEVEDEVIDSTSTNDASSYHTVESSTTPQGLSPVLEATTPSIPLINEVLKRASLKDDLRNYEIFNTVRPVVPHPGNDPLRSHPIKVTHINSHTSVIENLGAGHSSALENMTPQARQRWLDNEKEKIAARDFAAKNAKENLKENVMEETKVTEQEPEQDHPTFSKRASNFFGLSKLTTMTTSLRSSSSRSSFGSTKVESLKRPLSPAHLQQKSQQQSSIARSQTVPDLLTNSGIPALGYEIGDDGMMKIYTKQENSFWSGRLSAVDTRLLSENPKSMDTVGATIKRNLDAFREITGCCKTVEAEKSLREWQGTYARTMGSPALLPNGMMWEEEKKSTGGVLGGFFGGKVKK
jgi:hypothetical protein